MLQFGRDRAFAPTCTQIACGQDRDRLSTVQDVQVELPNSKRSSPRFGIDKASVKTYDQRKRKAIEIVEPIVQV